MGRRLLLILMAFLALIPTVADAADLVTWEMAYSLKSRRASRPKPIEPDAKRDDSGPFRLANEFDPPPDQLGRAAAEAPQLYELADAWNRRWQSPDPAWLQQWVARVNAQAQAQPPPTLQTRIYRGTTQCANGSCPTR